MPNCITCQNFKHDCMQTEVCKECYFVTDDNEIRIKPNYKLKININKNSSGIRKKLSSSQRKKISEDNRSISEIAKNYGISTTTVFNIKNQEHCG